MKEIDNSSHKIPRTIAVIDEIAFRANLLALSAAVTAAARAGPVPGPKNSPERSAGRD